jgi:hypothetical protein
MVRRLYPATSWDIWDIKDENGIAKLPGSQRRFSLPAGFCLNFRQFAVVVAKRNTISHEA